MPPDKPLTNYDNEPTWARRWLTFLDTRDEERGWRVGIVQNDPQAEVIRLRKLLNASEARAARLRETCQGLVDFYDGRGVVKNREYAIYYELKELMANAHAALADEEPPE